MVYTYILYVSIYFCTTVVKGDGSSKGVSLWLNRIAYFVVVATTVALFVAPAKDALRSASFVIRAHMWDDMDTCAPADWEWWELRPSPIFPDNLAAADGMVRKYFTVFNLFFVINSSLCHNSNHASFSWWGTRICWL